MMNPIILTKNRLMLKIFEKILKIKNSHVPVLIQGETGTGKELLAKYIYDNSPRNDKKFVQVNCSVFPDTLIESELFGHVKGAFTGASTAKIGVFEHIHKGTLFLDEIGDLSFLGQTKILQVLQSGEFKKVGGNEILRTDFRLISASNKNLYVYDGFREDLFYRINTVTFTLPPLRERIEDIPTIVEYLIGQFNQLLSKEIRGIDEKAMSKLLEFDWPGNVRQLRNIIWQASIMADSDVITSADIEFPQYDNSLMIEDEEDYNLERREKMTIMKALEKTQYKQNVACILLGITARTLNYKIKIYGFTHPSWKANGTKEG